MVLTLWLISVYLGCILGSTQHVKALFKSEKWSFHKVMRKILWHFARNSVKTKLTHGSDCGHASWNITSLTTSTSISNIQSHLYIPDSCIFQKCLFSYDWTQRNLSILNFAAISSRFFVDNLQQNVCLASVQLLVNCSLNNVWFFKTLISCQIFSPNLNSKWICVWWDVIQFQLYNNT